MKATNQTQITDRIRGAAQREAEAWHRLCCQPSSLRLEKKWKLTREYLADELRLRGDDRYRAPLIYQALSTLNGRR